MNDGIREETGDEFKCVCSDKYHGDLCEKKKGQTSNCETNVACYFKPPTISQPVYNALTIQI